MQVDLNTPSITDSLADLIRERKLDEAVDDDLASKDPQFANHLAEYRRSRVFLSPFGYSVDSTVEQRDYLTTARAEWWQLQERDVNVVLFDSELERQCGFPR
jgi:hypothetical protein